MSSMSRGPPESSWTRKENGPRNTPEDSIPYVLYTKPGYFSVSEHSIQFKERGTWLDVVLGDSGKLRDIAVACAMRPKINAPRPRNAFCLLNLQFWVAKVRYKRHPNMLFRLWFMVRYR
jgi:hypothetical protein